MIEKNFAKKYYNKLNFIYYGILIFLTGIFIFLAYRQSVKYQGKYISDYYYYIKQDDGFFINRAISTIFKFLKSPSGSTIGIAIFMGCVITGVIVSTAYLIKYISNLYLFEKEHTLLEHKNCFVSEEHKGMVQIGSIVALFSTAIYVPVFYEHFYMRTFSKWAWHSPTQQLMVLASIVSFLAFLKVYENYKNTINIKYWLIFMVATFVSAWAKPSYILVFAPTLLLFLIKDLFEKSEETFVYKLRSCIFMGVPVLPAGLYVIYVNFMEFNNPEETGNTSKVIIELGYFLRKSPHPLIMIFLSILFPLIVYFFNREVLKDRKHQIILTMFAVGVLEYVTFIESGKKANHGNFGWGRSVTLFITFASAIALFISNVLDKNFMQENHVLKKWYFLGAGCALAAHFISGIIYFIIVLSGNSYEI